MGRRRMHQLAAQMVHRRISAQIIPIGEIGIIEKRIFPDAGRLIFREQGALVQPTEKKRIGLSDLCGEKLFQIQEPLLPPFQTPAGNSGCAPVCRRFGLIKQSCTPHGISLKAQDVILRVSYCPTNGICTYVKAEIIRRISPDRLFLFHFAFSSIDKFQKSAKNISDPGYHLGLHYKFK